ncbi:hypothetical protein C1646_757728 [Rhizophagus diaphanus]|nr:hypothetical protein C1646_757728 [Rhizophagus diaphanus] [Rhizophagus sp. MUCL 43196]
MHGLEAFLDAWIPTLVVTIVPEFIYIEIVNAEEQNKKKRTKKKRHSLLSTILLYSTMPNNIEIQDTEHKNGWVNWVEEAIGKEYYKLYENNNFHNVQEIDSEKFIVRIEKIQNT